MAISDFLESTRQGVVEGIKTMAVDTLDFGRRALGNLVAGVNRTLPNMLPTATATLAELSYRGSQGSFASIVAPITLTFKYIDIAGTSPSKFGYPACKSRPPSTLSGFCLTQNAAFEISGTIDEQKALEDLFNSGVYLEWGDF